MSTKPRKDENPLAGDFAPPVERQYYTVGFLCQMLQQTPEFIHQLMRAADVQFAWAENGIGVIRGDDVVKMKQLTVEIREDIEGKAAAYQNN